MGESKIKKIRKKKTNKKQEEHQCQSEWFEESDTELIRFSDPSRDQ